MNISRKQQWVVESGDVIYNKLFAWKGSFAIAGADVHGQIASDKFPTYRHDPEQLDLGYLRYYFQTPSIAKQAENLSKGAAAISKLTLNPPQFWDLTIPLPPLVEQQRIVARIEALAGKIAAARRLREEATTETHLLLENLIDTAFEEIHHPAYPLRHLTTKIGSGSTPRGGKEVYAESGVPLIRSLNVRMRTFQWDGIAFISDDVHQQMAGTQVEPNDVLLNITGASIGRVSLSLIHI